MTKFLVLCFMFLISCSNVNNGEGVYLDKGYGWFNNTSSESVKSLTLKVVNNDNKDVYVDIVCYYMPEENVFGKTNIFVKSKNSKVFTIRGLYRSSEKIGCKIEAVK